MPHGEAFVRAFHAAHPGATTAAFARGGSYARLAAEVPTGARVLDLACGDGYLLELLGARGVAAIGVDVAAEEVRAATARGGRAVQGRAQALPFASAAFDAVTCHLALMLMADLDVVSGELARVLVPGGALRAVVGGGPVARVDPASPACVYARWLALLQPRFASAPPLRLGDPRASREAGWRALLEPRGFAAIGFTRIELDLGGTFDEVWATLSTSYDAARLGAADLREPLRAAIADLVAPDGHVPLRAVAWLASATRTRLA